MLKHACPHCGQAGISGLRKAFLGPALPAKCSCCGGKVGVPWWSLLGMLPFFIAIALLPLVRGNGVFSFWLGAWGALLTLLIWDSLVPLIKR